MPPKKVDPKAKPGADKGKGPSESVVPENECNYKVSMEVMHEGGHYMKIKYNWMDVKPDGTVTEMDLDTGFFKDWTLIQIEGEEAVPAEAEVPVAADPKAKAAPAKKPAGKPAPGGKVTMEEITDNRPRIVSYLHDFAENGISAMKITEAIAEKFTKQILRIQICSVNRETSEEGVDETIDIDISCLLFPRKTVEFEWKFDKLQTMAIHYLNVKVESDQPLLSDFLGKKLNPLQINLVAIKDIPYKVEPRFKPIYATCEFVDGQTFTTREMPQQPACRFQQKHVFLVGKHDPVLLKEMLATRLVRVYLHDCDEFVSEDTDVKFSVGQSQFTFKDFLRHYCRELKLRADIFPMKRVEVDNTQNLDLNTTARKNEKTMEKFSPYLNMSTYSVIQANLSHPIGVFNEAKELAALQATDENDADEGVTQAATLKKEESKSKLRPDSTVKSKRGSEGGQSTKDLPKADMGVTGMTNMSALSSQSLDVGKKDSETGAIFERMIIIVPYKSPDSVKGIQNTFERINLEGLGLENSRYLNTKELSEEEKNNRKLDFLGGFEIMDKEFRCFVVEGLGGEGHSMDQFYRANERERPNDKKYKMLYNPGVKFKNRIYQEFNVALKKIRLRDTLTQIIGQPDVYMRSKVPEDMYETLQKFAFIRRCDRMSQVHDFNLFPGTEVLLTLERKYGDSLNYEDLNGVKQRKRRRKHAAGVDTGTNASRTQGGGTDMSGTDGRSAMTRTEVQSAMSGGTTMMSASVMKANVDDEEESEEEETVRIGKRKADTDARNNQFIKFLREREEQDPINYSWQNKAQVKSMCTGRPLKQRLDVPEGFEVHMYGSQKNNIWEFQKDQMRKQVSQDKGNFYTYSKEHLSLAFPVVNENQIAVREKEQNEARWKTKTGFDYLMKRANLNEHPKKPHPTRIDDLKSSYAVEKDDQAYQMKARIYHPANEGKVDFMSKVNAPHKTFGDPAFFNTVFISGDDMVKEMAEEQKKIKQAWQDKVVVCNSHFTVNTRVPESQQLDKFRSIREEVKAGVCDHKGNKRHPCYGKCAKNEKIGLRISNGRSQTMVKRGLPGVSQFPSVAPVSMLALNEEYIMNEQKPKPMKQLDLTKHALNKDGTMNMSDLSRYTKRDTLFGQNPTSKTFIKPLGGHEKNGPKWGGK